MENYTTLVDLLIKDEMSGKTPRHETVLYLGDTPDYLVQHAGFSKHEILMTGKTLSKICFDHGIKTTHIKKIPEMIMSPQGLFLPANPQHRDSVVVLTFEFHINSPLIISIQKDKTLGRSRIGNVITSAYGKEGNDPIKKWKDANLLLWEPT